MWAIMLAIMLAQTPKEEALTIVYLANFLEIEGVLYLWKVILT